MRETRSFNLIYIFHVVLLNHVYSSYSSTQTVAFSHVTNYFSVFLESSVKVCKMLAESSLCPLGQIRGSVGSRGSCCQATEAPSLITLHSHTAELRHL